MAKSKISFKVNLSELVSTEALDKLSQSTKKRISGELGEFIVDKILEDTSNQRSAVSGQQWKGLSKEYKKEKSKIASGRANLELHGDMLDALKAVAKPDGVEVGVYGKQQALKADGHTHAGVFGQSTLPTRKFIPTGSERLRAGIMKEVVQIAKELVSDAPKKRGYDSSLIKSAITKGVSDGTES
jgi:hypothetical protein